MSLQVWLPLDGDLRNNGLSDVTVINNGAIINNLGKIGSCYSFDGSDDYISLSGSSLYDIFKGGAQEFSIAFWIYHNDATRGIIFGDYGLSGAINFNIELTTTHGVRFYWGGAPDKNFNSTSYVTASAWTHICITYNGSKLQIYRNGILSTDIWSGTLTTKNKTSGIFYLGRDSRTGTTALNGKLNDFRIYDHCLSQKEVKEISKALVLHYTLDDFALKNNNIIPNYLTMGLGSANPSTGTWRLAGTSNMSRSRVQIIDSPYGNCYGFQNSGIQTANDGSCYGIDNFPLEANTVYTISMFARITEGTEGYAGYNIYSATYSGGSWTHVDKNYRVTPLDSNGRWTRCWLTFTTNAATTRNIYIGITTGSTSVTTQMCCIRIEKGIPNFNTIYDTSGYIHNIIPSVKIIENINTPRYTRCIQMDGVNDHIIIPYNTICPDNIFTMNLWFYKSELGSKSYETLVGGPSGFEMDTRAGASTSLSLYMASTRGGNVFSPFEFNKWYMVTMVRDGTNEMYYINGELKKTIEAKAMPTGTYYIGSWAGTNKQNFKGLISDFRLYNSVLSEDDIRELYQVSASSDRNGNFYAYEYMEVVQ